MNKIKIIHFSDTHLGFNDLDIINDDNVNVREADFYNAFNQIIDYIIDIKPDFVIHTGDLFHRSSPSNRAITVALDGFNRLEETNIKVIMIAGNHSTPRSNLSSPILKIFDNFKLLNVAYNQAYEVFEYEDIIFHALPHINDEKKAVEEIEKIEANINKNKKNVLLMHASVGAHYLMQEFGEWVYPKDKEYLFDMIDYVALGHWHGFGNVGKYKNVYYSGSSERTSMNDKRNNKGFIKLKLDENDKNIDVNFKEITLRKILEFKIDCSNYLQEITTLNLEEIDDCIVEVTLQNLSITQSLDITTNDIKKIFEKALSVTIKREFKTVEQTNSYENIGALSLEDYFNEHLKENIEDENELKRLQSKTAELFNTYQEEYE